METVTTVLGDRDPDTLRKTVHVAADTDDLTTEWTEYCLPDCVGPAHDTGMADTPVVFCAHHIHHSVHVTLKRWPEGMGALLGGFN